MIFCMKILHPNGNKERLLLSSMMVYTFIGVPFYVPVYTCRVCLGSPSGTPVTSSCPRYTPGLSQTEDVKVCILEKRIARASNRFKQPYRSNGPRQANLVLIAYASSEGSGEPPHPRSLARTFAAPHTSSESRGTFRQKARSLARLNGWACAVKICHDGMLEDTNSLDGTQIIYC